MPARYWVGGTGTWSSTNTANWSTSSGGAGGATVPSVSDDVVFDGNSGTGVVTFTNSGSGANLLTLNNTNLELSLGAAITVNSSVVLTAGIFTTNNYNVTVAGAIQANSTSARTINLGSSTVTLSGGTPIDFQTTTNLVFNCGTSSINLPVTTGGTVTFYGGSQTFFNVSFTGANINIDIFGTNAFNNLSVAGRTTVGVKNFSLFANQTINGALTLSAGTNATCRTFVRSSTVGSTRTLTCASVATLTDIDFRDITIAGSAAPVSGTRLGDCKGNSGITFDAPKTVYWRATSGTNWAATTSSWSLTAGGAATHAAFPLAQDTAVFTVTYPSTGNITLNGSYNIGSIDWSARTVSNISLTTSTFTPVIYGNWIGGSGLTNSGTGQITFSGRGSQTISCVGVPFTQGITVDSPGGSVTLLDAFSTSRNSTGALTVTQGTFDANNYNVTLSGSLGTFISNASTARTVAIGSGTWTIVASSTTAWNVTTATNLTVTGTGTITLTSSSAKTFIGGGIQTYPTINQGGAGTLTITGSNKFANITNTALGVVRFTGGTTTEFGAFNLNGTSTAARLTVGSTDATQAILKKPTAWNVGTGSLDGGNNTGLSFTAGTNDFLSISGINGQLASSSVSVNVSLTGVASTCSVGSVTVVNGVSVNVPLTGVASTCSVGSVTVVNGVSVSVPLTGVASTCSVGSVTVVNDVSVNVPLTGVASTCSVGSVTVQIKININVTLIGVFSTLAVGQVTSRASAACALNGVQSSTAVGDVSVFNVLNVTVDLYGLQSNCDVGSVYVPAGLSIIIDGVYTSCVIEDEPVTFVISSIAKLSSLVTITNVGDVVVSNIIFDYNNVASFYDRTRTVYIDTKSSSKDRTVSIEAQPRVVYVEPKYNSYNRLVLVS